jgi:hypothetical protein
MNWRAARTFAEEIIGLRRALSGPGTRIRLLSGGQHAEADPGPGDGGWPRDHPGEPAGAGLGCRRDCLCAGQLIAARDRGAAVLLISEDLDEIMGLSDVIHVMSQGRLSPGFARDDDGGRAGPVDGGPEVRGADAA